MPYYTFFDPDIDEEWEVFITITERDEYLRDNPRIVQRVTGFPADADSYRLGRTKPAAGFRDLLRQVKKNNIRSTIRDV